MSKIGRKPIQLGNVHVTIDGDAVNYKGEKFSGVHILPKELKIEMVDKSLRLTPVVKTSRANVLWGLHRALLANKIKGAGKLFEKQLKIVGLGFKAVLAGGKLQFSLGFSHKIDFVVPHGVSVEVDKTGQSLVFKSSDLLSLGEVCSQVRSLRPPEPYKGTGIQYANEIIKRKAGKTKAA